MRFLATALRICVCLCAVRSSALQLNYDEEFVYPAKADQFAITELAVGNTAIVQWKSIQPAGTQASLWLSHVTSTTDLCPHTNSAQCAKVADLTISEGTRKRYEWKVSRMGMSYGDLYYFRLFYNTTNPVSLGAETYIQSGYMTIRLASQSTPSNGTGTNTSSIAPDTPSSPPDTPAIAQKVTRSNLPLIIGAAAGIPLGLLVLVALLATVLHHRRKAAQAAMMSEAALPMCRTRSAATSDQAVLLDNQLPRLMLDGYPKVAHAEVSHELAAEVVPRAI